MRKWEYLVRWQGDWENLEIWLNELAAEGWVLDSVMHRGNGRECVLSREIRAVAATSEALGEVVSDA